MDRFTIYGIVSVHHLNQIIKLVFFFGFKNHCQTILHSTLVEDRSGQIIFFSGTFYSLSAKVYRYH